MVLCDYIQGETLKKFGLFALLGGLALAVVYFVTGERFALFTSAAFCGMGYFGMTYKSKHSASNEPLGLESVDQTTRSRLRPIIRLREEIFAILDDSHDDFIISAMDMDVRTEVNSAMTHSIETAKQKRQTQKLMNTLYASQLAVDELREKLKNATDDDIKQSAQTALNSRLSEKKNYDDLEAATKKMDANLDQTEAMLAELRSKIVMAKASNTESNEDSQKQQLEDMTTRLRTLTKTMEESTEILKTEGTQ